MSPIQGVLERFNDAMNVHEPGSSLAPHPALGAPGRGGWLISGPARGQLHQGPVGGQTPFNIILDSPPQAGVSGRYQV